MRRFINLLALDIQSARLSILSLQSLLAVCYLMLCILCSNSRSSDPNGQRHKTIGFYVQIFQFSVELDQTFEFVMEYRVGM